MSEPLDKLETDLSQLLTLIEARKTTSPLEYDLDLRVPYWQKTGVEDFAQNLAADVAKFQVHLQLWIKPEEGYGDREDHQVKLLEIAQRLTNDFTYLQQQPAAADAKVAAQLKTQLQELPNLLNPPHPTPRQS